MKTVLMAVIVGLVIGSAIGAAIDVGAKPVCADILGPMPFATESDCQPRFADGSPAIVTPESGDGAPWYVIPGVVASGLFVLLLAWPDRTPIVSEGLTNIRSRRRASRVRRLRSAHRA